MARTLALVTSIAPLFARVLTLELSASRDRGSNTGSFTAVCIRFARTHVTNLQLTVVRGQGSELDHRQERGKPCAAAALSRLVIANG